MYLSYFEISYEYTYRYHKKMFFSVDTLLIFHYLLYCSFQFINISVEQILSPFPYQPFLSVHMHMSAAPGGRQGRVPCACLLCPALSLPSRCVEREMRSRATPAATSSCRLPASCSYQLHFNCPTHRSNSPLVINKLWRY